MLKHPAKTETRIHRSLHRIERLILAPSHPVEIGAWVVGSEPVPYAQAAAATYTPFKVGDPWGALWDTTWFRIRGTVPPEWKGREVVACVRLTDQPGEGFTAEGLVYRDGVPEIAINVHRAEVKIARCAEGGESFEFFVEAASNGKTAGDGKLENLLLPEYHGKPIYRLEEARLSWVDREAFAYYHDFKLAAEAMAALPETSRRRGELRYALNESLNRLDFDDAATVPAAREALAGVMASRNGDTSHTISAVGHAHIDTAWLWPLRESIRKCARTFSTALDYMERYPEYVFVCSQAQQYAWMKAYYPTIWKRIQAAVKRGQWEPVGSMWVETDCNIASGESLVRQILHGKRFFEKELGYETRDVWIPDVFGYSAAMPQIMKQAGVDYFLTQKISWSEFNKFPHHTFLWEGLDGTRIFTHFPPTDTYNAAVTPKELVFHETNFRDHDRASRSILVYGFGDGGGGPTIEMQEKLDRLEDFNGLPKVVREKALTFFEKAEQDARDLPVWVGELYLEFHRGTYTTQAHTKRSNRLCEWLLGEAELLDAVTLAHVPGRTERVADPERAVYDVTGLGETGGTYRAALDRAWKLILLNQFHDIIPGSSIHWVYLDAARDYAAAKALGESVRDDALGTLAAQIDTAAVEKPVLLLNPTTHSRREVIDLPGLETPALVETPACGYAVVSASATPLPPEIAPVALTREETGGFILENGLVRVRIAPEGTLSSVFDLRAGREALSAPGNRFDLHQDIPNQYDAWDIEVFYREKCTTPERAVQVEAVETGPLRSAVRVVWEIGKSRIDQKIVLRAGSARIDFVTDVEWQETQKLLKVAFPVDIRSSRATYEIQYGHLERPTHTNTSWDMARFEVCAQKWADLSEPGYGVALLNDCKYGHDIAGNVMRLSLLRSSITPDPVADRGHHHFTYALLPHAGDFRTAGVIGEAYALNRPLRALPVEAHAGSLPAADSFFQVDGPGVVIEAVKVAEERGATIVRLYEAHGGRGSVRLGTSLPFTRAWRSDLMENALSPLPFEGRSVELALKPFEIVTLRFE